MSFKSILETIGGDAKKVFAYLGSAQGQATVAGVEGAAETVAAAINPAAGVAVTGIVAIFNAALKQVLATESLAAAAGAQNGTGVQKAAAVTAAITPGILAYAMSQGLPAPTEAQIQGVVNGIVAALNALPGA